MKRYTKKRRRRRMESSRNRIVVAETRTKKVTNVWHNNHREGRVGTADFCVDFWTIDLAFSYPIFKPRYLAHDRPA